VVASSGFMQGCYNTGVAASAGTHDFDGVVDVEVENMDWLDGQRFLREHGWAAWYRFPPKFGNHLHAVSLGCPGPVGIYVPGQVDDYYAHRNGLAGHDRDITWYPADIDSTVFDYPAWEDALNADDKKWLSDLIDAKLAANNTTLVKAVWDAAVDKAQTTALRKAGCAAQGGRHECQRIRGRVHAGTDPRLRLRGARLVGTGGGDQVSPAWLVKVTFPSYVRLLIHPRPR
jgi:hypothetical protein